MIYPKVFIIATGILILTCNLSFAQDDFSSSLTQMNEEDFDSFDFVDEYNLSLEAAGGTPNQRAIGEAIEHFGFDNGLYNLVAYLPTNIMQDAFASLSGELHASALSVFLEESRYLRNATMHHLYQDSLLQSSSTWSVWGQGFGGWGNLKGAWDVSAVQRDTQGIFLGGDRFWGSSLRGGVVAGYSQSDFDIAAKKSLANGDNYHLGLYGAIPLAPWVIRLAIANTWHQIETQRTILFPDFTNFSTSDYGLNTFQTFGELGYDVIYSNATIEPFAGFAFVNVDSGFWVEQSGLGSLYGEGSHNVFYTTLGLRETSVLFTRDRFTVNESIDVGWRHAFATINPQSIVAFTGTCFMFGIEGAAIARDALLIDAGITLWDNNNLSLRLAYTGQLATEVDDHGATVTLVWQM